MSKINLIYHHFKILIKNVYLTLNMILIIFLDYLMHLMYPKFNNNYILSLNCIKCLNTKTRKFNNYII